MKRSASEPLVVFTRQVRARSAEHRAALGLLQGAGLHSVGVGLLRLELDSLIRVMYLLAVVDRRRRVDLIKDSISGRRWRNENGRPVTDRQMVRLASRLKGWAESVYKFGCAFIHLSDFHDRGARDPFKSLPTSEQRDIIKHVEYYHGRFATKTPGFDDLATLVPRVFDKIAGNLEAYLETLRRGGSLE